MALEYCWFLLFLGTCFLELKARPDGADPLACVHMTPMHARYTSLPTKNAPFSVRVSRSTYSAAQNNSIVVTLQGTRRFKGFLLEARSIDWTRNSNEPLGTFTSLNPQAKLMCQSKRGDAVTHSRRLSTARESFTWVPKGGINPGHIKFVATFVENFRSFYVMVPSKSISERGTPELSDPPKVAEVLQPSANLVETMKGCGDALGCFRHPKNCGDEGEPGCEYLLMWSTDSDDVITFTMSGVRDGYIAMGLSTDSKMGDDSVLACVRNTDTNAVTLEYGVTNGKSYERKGNAPLLSFSFSGGRLTCTFRRPRDAPGQTRSFYKQWRLLMAAGPSYNDDNRVAHIGRHSMQKYGFPVHSAGKINFLEKSDDTASTRYHLAKAHGILMLVAWIGCCSIAIVLALYYKNMWPRRNPGGEKTWFQMHRGLQIGNVVLTLIAFVLIFIEVGGYSQLAGSPEYVHPILGIVVTILVVLNPLMSLLRCKPGSKHRPWFNWCHWLFGSVAHFLAVFAAFIGMNLGKAHVPTWATWVLFIWCIVHLVVVIILEIHGCCMARKNRERAEEWEMKRRDYPDDYDYMKDPPPKGQKCKCVMLSIYLVVTVLAVLIILFAIAIY